MAPANKTSQVIVSKSSPSKRSNKKQDIHILQQLLPALTQFSFTFVANQTPLNELS